MKCIGGDHHALEFQLADKLTQRDDLAPSPVTLKMLTLRNAKGQPCATSKGCHHVYTRLRRSFIKGTADLFAIHRVLARKILATLVKPNLKGRKEG